MRVQVWVSRFAFRIEGKGVDIGKAYSADLVGFYFDLDDDSERSSPNQPYVLGINLVYDSSDGAHAQQAKRAATKLRDLIARKCKKSGQWRWIELTYCEAAPISWVSKFVDPGCPGLRRGILGNFMVVQVCLQD